MRKKSVRFVVCVNNKGYASSLELGKLYRLIPDEDAAAEGLVRITDESGEDYAFDAERFLDINVPERVQAALFPTAVSTKARKSNVAITRAKRNASAVRKLQLNRERELRRNR